MPSGIGGERWWAEAKSGEKYHAGLSGIVVWIRVWEFRNPLFFGPFLEDCFGVFLMRFFWPGEETRLMGLSSRILSGVHLFVIGRERR